MIYNKKISVYRLKMNFNVPLNTPGGYQYEIMNSKAGDVVLVTGNKFWIQDCEDRDKYRLALADSKFVLINDKLFEKL